MLNTWCRSISDVQR